MLVFLFYCQCSDRDKRGIIGTPAANMLLVFVLMLVWSVLEDPCYAKSVTRCYWTVQLDSELEFAVYRGG